MTSRIRLRRRQDMCLWLGWSGRDTSVIDVLPGGSGALVGAGRDTRPRSHILQLLGRLQCPSPVKRARAAPEPSNQKTGVLWP